MSDGTTERGSAFRGGQVTDCFSGPTASVIIPLYNTEKYIVEAVNSVLHQTYEDFEVVIIDDGSTDRSASLAKSFDDPRVRYIYQKNKGIAGARNTGIRNMRGQYAVFLDADDTLLPDKLRSQVAWLDEHPEISVVAGRCIITDAKGKYLVRNSSPEGMIELRDILVSGPCPIHCYMLRKSWVDRAGFFDESFVTCEDRDYECRLALLGCTFYRMPMTNWVCTSRKMAGTMTTKPLRQTEQMLRVIDKTFSKGGVPAELVHLKEKAIGETCLTGAIRAYIAKQPESGKAYFQRAMECVPKIRENRYEAVRNRISSFTQQAQVPSEIPVYDVFRHNLPDSAKDLAPILENVVYGLRRENTNRLRKTKKWIPWLWNETKLAFQHPRLVGSARFGWALGRIGAGKDGAMRPKERALDVYRRGRRLLRLGKRIEDPASALDRGDAGSNIAWNRDRWGKEEIWRGTDAYGYRWGGGHQQANYDMTLVAEKWFLPHLDGRRDLKTLELAPGAGRFTVELVRASRSLHLVDMNASCIEICKDRFKYYPNISYYVNDGRSCAVVPDSDFDLIASYDSMVHMLPEIIEGYVKDFAQKLKSSGLLWLDHSGRGEKTVGHRTAMTDQMMRAFAERYGLTVIAQHFRNDHDCISVLQKL